MHANVKITQLLTGWVQRHKLKPKNIYVSRDARNANRHGIEDLAVPNSVTLCVTENNVTAYVVP